MISRPSNEKDDLSYTPGFFTKLHPFVLVPNGYVDDIQLKAAMSNLDESVVHISIARGFPRY